MSNPGGELAVDIATAPDSVVQFNESSGDLGSGSNIPLTAQHTFSVPEGAVLYDCTGQVDSESAGGDIDFILNNFVCMFFPTRY